MWWYSVIEPVQHSGFQNLVAMATLVLCYRGGRTEMWLGGWRERLKFPFIPSTSLQFFPPPARVTLRLESLEYWTFWFRKWCYKIKLGSRLRTGVLKPPTLALIYQTFLFTSPTFMAFRPQKQTQNISGWSMPPGLYSNAHLCIRVHNVLKYCLLVLDTSLTEYLTI